MQDDKAMIREMSECLKDLGAGGVRETTFKIDFGMRRQQGHRTWRRIKNKMLKDGLLREEVRAFLPVTGSFARQSCAAAVQGVLSARHPHPAGGDGKST